MAFVRILFFLMLRTSSVLLLTTISRFPCRAFSIHSHKTSTKGTTNTYYQNRLMTTSTTTTTTSNSHLRSTIKTEDAASTTPTDTTEPYDLVVLGGGSGGVRCSRIAAGYGKRVVLVETQLQHGAPNYSAIGGTCVNVGCVPKKLMVFASRYRNDVNLARGYGWEGATAGPKFDWQYFMQTKDDEITRLNNVYQKNVLGSAGVEIIEGRGEFIDPHTVRVVNPQDGNIRDLKAHHVVVATGGWPYKPNIPGIEHTITSNEIFYLSEQPKRIVVVGGGFIALEFATIMDGLGSTVSLLYRGDLFLRGFDHDIRQHIKDEMGRNTKIDMQFSTNPIEIIKNDNDGTLTVVTDTGKRIDCDCVLMATGRKGQTASLQLEKAGVTVHDSFIPVDQYSQTNIPHIYAVGDVTNRIALTPVALMEGHRLADTLFGGKDRPVDHDLVASTVFTSPVEVGTVGLTEEDAVAQYKNVVVYKTKFRPMKYAFPKSETYSLFKLIVDGNTDKVLGCHLATDGAGEMIQGVAIAIKMGATKADFDNTIGIHPTSAEELVTLRTPSYRYIDGVKH
jgi:glutathione reductase (NADPH)